MFQPPEQIPLNKFSHHLIPILSLSSTLGNLSLRDTPHIHHIILIFVCSNHIIWSAFIARVFHTKLHSSHMSLLTSVARPSFSGSLTAFYTFLMHNTLLPLMLNLIFQSVYPPGNRTFQLCLDTISPIHAFLYVDILFITCFSHTLHTNTSTIVPFTPDQHLWITLSSLH